MSPHLTLFHQSSRRRPSAMETQYCPRPPPSPPPTPPPDPSSAEPSDLLLNEESDVLWLSALDIARSVQDPTRGKSTYLCPLLQPLFIWEPRHLVEPYHLLLALLYKGLKNIDEVLFRKPPVLDVSLLWKVVHEAGGNPVGCPLIETPRGSNK